MRLPQVSSFLGFFLYIQLLLPQQGQAQDSTSTETRIRVFEYGDHVKSSSLSTYSTAFKLNPYGLLNGEIPVFAERRITPKISLEASLGITMKDYISRMYQLMWDEEYENPFDNELSEFRTQKTGYTYSLAFRYFPSADYDAIEGLFFGIMWKHRAHFSEIDPASMNGRYPEVTSVAKEKRVVRDLALIFGQQIFWDANISSEWMIGLGYRNTANKYLNLIEQHDPQTDTYERKAVMQEKPFTGPSLILAWKLGFGF
ncbi:MAG: hypothetical protein KF690_04160 [Bacteroidetes bacterium]|nr:hypothetical protein [Bacteroidota bacterium]